MRPLHLAILRIERARGLIGFHISVVHVGPNGLEVILQLLVNSYISTALRRADVGACLIKGVSGLRKHVPVLTGLLEVLHTILELSLLLY